MTSVKPFIKWAGGKTQLLDEIRRYYPANIEKYCEPFVGGGAVLFDVLSRLNPKEVLINDINSELINTYSQIKTNCEGLIAILNDLQEKYLNSSLEEKKNLYLEKRKRFNSLKMNGRKKENLEKAALFIFLNKTCFNGLFRVNSKGLFNVPFNNAKKPLLCDASNLKACSELLQKVKMSVGNYAQCWDFIDSKTFIYIDPPYRPLTKTAAFTSYNENGFGDKEQVELAYFINKLSEKGAQILASNSDPKNVDYEDDFFDNLYSKFVVNRVSAGRFVNSKGDRRGKISELLITNLNQEQKFKFTAEELFSTPANQKLFREEIGDPQKDSFAKIKLNKDFAKTKNYEQGVYYHAEGGTGEIGLGLGLYLGKDMNALHNFYNGEGEFGGIIVKYYGFPKFIDLADSREYELFEREAVAKFGMDKERSYLKKYTLQKGFDGIRYYDISATGEEFVLFNSNAVKEVEKIQR